MSIRTDDHPFKRFWTQFAEVVAENPDISIEVAGRVPGGSRHPDKSIVFPKRHNFRTEEAGPIELPDAAGHEFDPCFVYEAEVLLVQHEDAESWVRSLEPGAERDDRYHGPSAPERRADDAIVLRVPARDADARSGVLYVLDLLAAEDPGRADLGEVTPNYLVSICNVNLCPADEPTLPHPEGQPMIPGSPAPPQRQDTSGAGTFVMVIDTGRVQGFDDYLHVYPWMGPRDVATVDGDPNKIGQVEGEPRLGPHDGIIDEYVGHGTFIAGVVRCMAPDTQIWISGALKNAGAMSEAAFVAAVRDVLAGFAAEREGRWPEVVSLSAGTRTLNGQALQSMKSLMAELRAEHPETVLVAAAGNDGESDPFFPAAYFTEEQDLTRPAVLSVGALDDCEKHLAAFSNFGDWVALYARGGNHVNAFAVGEYTAPLGPTAGQTHLFHGMARWSGTSFATPLIAGLIAARASAAGSSTREAAGWVLAAARDQAEDGRPLIHANQPVQ